MTCEQCRQTTTVVVDGYRQGKPVKLCSRCSGLARRVERRRARRSQGQLFARTDRQAPEQFR